MTREIKKVLQYFSHFSYPPSEDEIYSFCKKRLSRSEFSIKLASTVARKKLVRGLGTAFGDIKVPKYTLEGYSIFLKKNKRFSLYSQSKLKKTRIYIFVLKMFPQILFAGLSGSISMMHADKDDDVDFFIITSKKRLWTGRFLANLLALFMGLKRKRLVEQAKDKICLNLFFDEANTTVPKFKQNEYVAHEILQVKPVINKKNTYERFLA